tara:strand:- start:1633 stop:1869 length:237 start_codon:yes stop_codon:yes gene_type:complete
MTAPKPALNFKPRGLEKNQAAVYVGVGGTKFTEMVDDGRMPKPRQIDSKEVWDTQELDFAFDELPHKQANSNNPWDDM